MSHTKEPWKYDPPEESHCGIAWAPLGIIFDDGSISDANARRIVACVNACEGWSTMFLESVIISGRGPLQKLSDETVLALHKAEQQRDELLAICRNVVERGIGASDVRAMEAAIANAEAKP